jgi:hypothetical protein
MSRLADHAERAITSVYDVDGCTNDAPKGLGEFEVTSDTEHGIEEDVRNACRI